MLATKRVKKYYRHKSHYCTFCRIEIPRTYEHFTRKHCNEERVKEILRMKDKQKRFWLWKKLTQEGDNYFNNQIKDQLQQRKIVNIPRKETYRKRYFTCQKCFSRIRTTSKNQHAKVCDKVLPQTTSRVQIEQDFYNGMPENVINKLRSSKRVSPFLKYLSDLKSTKNMHTLMTDLIQLEENMQKIKNNQEPLIAFLCVSEIDNLITVIKDLCEFRQTSEETYVRYPFKAFRLWKLIRDFLRFLTLYCRDDFKETDLKNLTEFGEKFQTECNKKLLKKALKTIKDRQLKNRPRLPKLKDLNYLIKKLKEETPKLMEDLKVRKVPSTWRKLAENLLCRLTIFNRRRGGAIAKMKVEDYKSTEIRAKILTEEAISELDEEDIHYLETIKLVEISSESNNLIPIVINKPLQEAMDLLLKFRNYADISEENEYFFAAKRNSLNPIRSVAIMEKYRQWLPEEVRNLITARNLRKHGATAAQLLDLCLQDKEELSHHHGHSVLVNDKYDRNKELVTAILKTRRILTVLDEGAVKILKEKDIADPPFRETTTRKTRKKRNSQRAAKTTTTTRKTRMKRSSPRTNSGNPKKVDCQAEFSNKIQRCRVLRGRTVVFEETEPDSDFSDESDSYFSDESDSDY